MNSFMKLVEKTFAGMDETPSDLYNRWGLSSTPITKSRFAKTRKNSEAKPEKKIPELVQCPNCGHPFSCDEHEL